MHRRLAPLFLAVLIALPIAVPANATEPSASPPPAASDAPSSPPPAVEPTAEPTTEPTTEPSPAPSTEPETSPAPGDAVGDRGHDRRPGTGRFHGSRHSRRDRPLHRDAAERRPTPRPWSTRPRKRDGVKADRSFGKAIHGFSAKLDTQQKRDLQADPNVARASSRTRSSSMTQTTPTGVSRVGGAQNKIAAHRRHGPAASTPTSPSSTPGSPPSRTSTSRAATTARPRTTPRGVTRTTTGRTSRARSARSTTASASSASRRAPGCGPSRSSTTTATG